jgi:tRNA 2-selenouridine synthase
LAVAEIHISNYIECAQDYLVIDVRSPSEFVHARIPEAHNIPLFNNDERAIIGTTYKQKSRALAIKQGLDFYGPKMRLIVEKVEELKASANKKKILVHCWRGGMRSGAIAWLLDLYGFEVSKLIGGYKSFRRFCLDELEKQHLFTIIGGRTGAGKTKVLACLRNKGETVICLETLACHRGSSFGAIEMPPQPSQEQFENILALELHTTANKNIFLEDESQRIGRVIIPNTMWHNMRTSSVFYLDLSQDLRLQNTIDDYGTFEITELKDATNRIAKNLGGTHNKEICALLDNNEIEPAFALLLNYYDRVYDKASDKRKEDERKISKIICDTREPDTIADLIINYKKNK